MEEGDKKNTDVDMESEEDEDYVPEKNNDSDSENDMDNNDETDAMKFQLSTTKRKNVQDAFDSLFGDSSTTVTTVNDKVSDLSFPSEKSHPTMNSSDQMTKKAMKRRKVIQKRHKRFLRKRKRFLTELFGKKEAIKMIRRIEAKRMSDNDSTKLTTARKKEILQKIHTLPQKKVVTEVKKFAGKEIKIQKVVMQQHGQSNLQLNDTVQQSTNNKTATISKISSTNTSLGDGLQQSKQGGIDSVLAELSGPQKISTITKTSADWDLFKDRSGLVDKEELEKKTKGNDAFLVKKDFLQRVDVRQFEIEKKKRDKKRASSGKM